MKIYRLQGDNRIDGMTISEEATPRPKRGQLLVRMRAVSLNYRDLLIAVGRYRLIADQIHKIVPLSDGSGEVAELGEDVTRFKAGDRVVNAFVPGLITGQARPDSLTRMRGAPHDGVLAEYAVFEQDDLVALPPKLSFADGACMPCAGVTAWNALYCGPQPLLPGQTVLVLGTGGVSMFALQLAHAGGAGVIMTSSSDEKLHRARALGAWQGINYQTHPEWQEEVKRLTGGRGVDHTVENGGPGTLARSVAATRFGGSVGMIGVLVQGEINPIAVMHQGIILRSILSGSRDMLEDTIRAFDFHKLHPVIDRVFPFAEAAAAYHYLESAAHVGKVVIAID
jgi:NADPH:quinone reductase-like Zn-dependent oxidoreductase